MRAVQRSANETSGSLTRSDTRDRKIPRMISHFHGEPGDRSGPGYVLRSRMRSGPLLRNLLPLQKDKPLAPPAEWIDETRRPRAQSQAARWEYRVESAASAYR